MNYSAPSKRTIRNLSRKFPWQKIAGRERAGSEQAELAKTYGAVKKPSFSCRLKYF